MPDPTFEAPDIVQRSNDDVPKIISCFMAAFVETFLQVAYQGNQRIVLELIAMLAYPSFKINTIKWHVKSLVYYKDICNKWTREGVESDGFNGVLLIVHCDERGGYRTLYRKFVTLVPREHVELCRKTDIMFYQKKIKNFQEPFLQL